MLKSPFDMTGQHVVVTGAGGAIGSAAARAIAALGAKVDLVDLAAPDDLAKELKDSGTEARAYELNVINQAEVEKLFRHIGAVDALCDCVGYYGSSDWRAGGEPWSDLFHKTMDINVLGPTNLIRAALPGMIERKSGRIALTTSSAARNAGTTMAIEPGYVASKGALQALVRYFAKQAVGHGIVVNAVCPGPVMTPLLKATNQKFEVDKYPMRRLGEPEEIGQPLAFLCSKATGYMTGAVMDVNGGLLFS